MKNGDSPHFQYKDDQIKIDEGLKYVFLE